MKKSRYAPEQIAFALLHTFLCRIAKSYLYITPYRMSRVPVSGVGGA